MIIAETVAAGRMICIMKCDDSTPMLLSRDEAVELFEKLPALISEMPKTPLTDEPKTETEIE